LENLEDLICMSGLDTLNAAKNNMTDLDQVAFVLRSLRFLRVLDLRDNPLVKNPKYKEKTIGYMNRLGENNCVLLTSAKILQFFKTRCCFQRSWMERT